MVLSAEEYGILLLIVGTLLLRVVNEKDIVYSKGRSYTRDGKHLLRQDFQEDCFLITMKELSLRGLYLPIVIVT